jgi:hypothetical protein
MQKTLMKRWYVIVTIVILCVATIYLVGKSFLDGYEEGQKMKMEMKKYSCTRSSFLLVTYSIFLTKKCGKSQFFCLVVILFLACEKINSRFIFINYFLAEHR